MAIEALVVNIPGTGDCNCGGGGAELVGVVVEREGEGCWVESSLLSPGTEYRDEGDLMEGEWSTCVGGVNSNTYRYRSDTVV